MVDKQFSKEQCEKRFDEIVNKYHPNVTFIVTYIAREVTKLRVADDDNDNEKFSYTNEQDNAEVRKLIKRYKSDVSNFRSGNKQPKKGTVQEYIHRAIGCTDEEFEMLYLPKNRIRLDEDDRQLLVANDNTPMNNNISTAEASDNTEETDYNGHNVLIYNEPVNPEDGQRAKQSGFKYLKAISAHIYSVDNSAQITKTFDIKALKDKLQILEKVDSCEFLAHESPKIERGRQDKRYVINKDDFGRKGIIIGLTLNTPLAQEQIIDNVTIKYSCGNLEEGDNLFGSSRVLHQADWLVIFCTPPDFGHYEYAKVIKYENRDDYLARRHGIKLGDLSLDGASSFIVKIKNPTPYAYYVIDWS